MTVPQKEHFASALPTVAQLRGSTLPLQVLPPACCSHMCLLILQKTKSAEKEGERGRVVSGWIGDLLQFIPVDEVAGADPRERVQTEGSGRLRLFLWQQPAVGLGKAVRLHSLAAASYATPAQTASSSTLRDPCLSLVKVLTV